MSMQRRGSASIDRTFSNTRFEKNLLVLDESVYASGDEILECDKWPKSETPDDVLDDIKLLARASQEAAAEDVPGLTGD